MERWAKKLNTQTETRKAAVKQAQQELRMLEQKEEELRKKIQMGNSVTENLANVAKAKVPSCFFLRINPSALTLQEGWVRDRDVNCLYS